MGQLTKNKNSDLVSLLHSHGNGLVVPKPFERDIFLFDTYVAGTTHIEGIEELEQKLKVNDKLDFFS